MQTEPPESSEFVPITEHVTHVISLTSYTDALLLLVCLAVALFARLRMKIRPASFVATGFALLLLRYLISLVLVSFQSLANSYPVLDLSMWLGPAGLSCLALGLYKSYQLSWDATLSDQQRK